MKNEIHLTIICPCYENKTNILEGMWIYNITIIVTDMFRSPFVAIFREVFLQRMYYKDNKAHVEI
jgi:hypothetical protein